VTFSFVRKTFANAGAYTLNGQAITFPRTYRVQAIAGVYILNGQDVDTVAAQCARPDADITDGSWTNEADSNVNLFASIDELVANDTDYIKSAELTTGQTDTTVIRLSDLADPGLAVHHRLRCRFKKTGTNTMNLTVGIYQGATEIKSYVYNNVSTSYVDVDETLSEAEADEITDYTDLRVKFIAEAA
jgi:hypothetical protein